MKNMDYEKKYNEALDWMRELYPGLHGATKHGYKGVEFKILEEL